jgi:ssDNA-binding replication factor A large subunit
MNILDLKDGMKKVDVTGVVKELSEEKTVNLKAGGTARVRDAKIEDSTGSITLSLWNDDIAKVKKDSVVAVTNGFVTTFQKVIRLNVGKYGKLSVDGS